MNPMDTAIFHGIQSLVGLSPALDGLGVFCASVLIWIEAAAVVVFFLQDRRRFLVLASAAVSAVLAWLASDFIGLVYFRPRPFAALADARLLISKSPLDKSFPSDHATIAFALAFAVYQSDRRWGGALLAIAAVIALARVFVGVHYFSDIAAGAFLGMIVAFVVHRLVHKILRTKHHLIKTSERVRSAARR
jgi:undecaprenyl-diphosphatase